jgi:hypothetical protein
MQADRCNVVLNLLGERIGEASESTHVHPHREVLALYVAGVDVFLVRGARDPFHPRSQAGVVAQFEHRGISQRWKGCNEVLILRRAR